MPDPRQPIEPSGHASIPVISQTLERVREQPGKSIGSAFVVGLILSILPVGRLVSFFVGLALTLLRPLLLVFGAVKLWEEVGRRRK